MSKFDEAIKGLDILEKKYNDFYGYVENTTRDFLLQEILYDSDLENKYDLLKQKEIKEVIKALELGKLYKDYYELMEKYEPYYDGDVKRYLEKRIKELENENK